MNSKDRAAKDMQPSSTLDAPKGIVFTDAFEKRKKAQAYESALKKILERSRKTNW